MVLSKLAIHSKHDMVKSEFFSLSLLYRCMMSPRM